MILLVTHAAHPEFEADDLLLVDALKAQGHQVEPAVWDDASIKWAKADAVILRSPWDYHEKPKEYEAWLKARIADQTKLHNPAEIILGNLNKRYLLDFIAAGVDVIPMAYYAAGGSVRLDELLKQRGWNSAVVKPAVSAGGRGTWLTTQEEAKSQQERFAEQLANVDMIIQEFREEIETQGEWSLIFFQNEFSHAVLKLPASGEFRVQQRFGGTHEARPAPEQLIEQAASILKHIPTTLLYARVDGIEAGGKFYLMELEIHEPALFFGEDKAAAGRMASKLELG